MKKPSASKEVRPSWKKHPKGRYHTRIFDPLWSKLLPKKKISNTYCRPSLDSFYEWVEGRPHSVAWYISPFSILFFYDFVYKLKFFKVPREGRREGRTYLESLDIG